MKIDNHQQDQATIGSDSESSANLPLGYGRIARHPPVGSLHKRIS